MRRSGATSAAGRSRGAGRRTSSSIRRSTPTGAWRASSSGSRQMSSTVSAASSASRRKRACSAYSCSASSRSSAAARSRSHGHAHQLVRAERAARALPAVGDVGLDRPEVAAAVEDDGQRVAQRQAGHAQRDGGRVPGVDQGPLEQFVGFVLVHPALLGPFSDCGPTQLLPAFTAERLGTLGQTWAPSISQSV